MTLKMIEFLRLYIHGVLGTMVEEMSVQEDPIKAIEEDVKAIKKATKEIRRGYHEAWKNALETYNAPPHRVVFRAIKKQFSKKNKK